MPLEDLVDSLDGLEAFEEPAALEEAGGVDAEEDVSEAAPDLAPDLSPDSLLSAFFRSAEG